jgi:hypothetical protein
MNSCLIEILLNVKLVELLCSLKGIHLFCILYFEPAKHLLKPDLFSFFF